MLELVASGAGPELEIPVVEGEHYYLAIDSGLQVRFRLDLSPVGDNDAFEDRAAVLNRPGYSPSGVGAMIGATVEPGEPDVALVGDVRSVWWSWTAPTDGETRFSLYVKDETAVAAIFTGDTVESLLPILIGADDNQFYAEKGTTYQILITDVGVGGGDYSFALVGPSVPPSMAVWDQRLGVSGRIGQPFRLFHSADLREWTEMGVDTLQDEFFDLSPGPSTDERSGFYRVEPLEFDGSR